MTSPKKQRLIKDDSEELMAARSVRTLRTRPTQRKLEALMLKGKEDVAYSRRHAGDGDDGARDDNVLDGAENGPLRLQSRYAVFVFGSIRFADRNEKKNVATRVQR